MTEPSVECAMDQSRASLLLAVDKGLDDLCLLDEERPDDAAGRGTGSVTVHRES